jgi:hypothetical protein
MTPPDALVLLLAAVLGALLARHSLCALAGALALADGRPAALLAQLATLCAAGVALLALVLLLPERPRLPASEAVMLRVVAGGAVLALGAALNGACYLGTVFYLARGRLEYLATLAGIALAARWLPSAHPFLVAGAASLRSLPATTLVAGLGAFAVGGVATGWLLARAPGAGEAGPEGAGARARYAVLVGVVAACLYVRAPHFSYAAALGALARGDTLGPDARVLAAPLAMFGGALLSNGWRHAFRARRPRIAALVRCLAGGAVLGAGAALVPGGNDLLLLWGAPGLAPHAAVALATVFATLIVLAGAARAGRALRAAGGAG